MTAYSPSSTPVQYGREIEEEIARLEALIAAHPMLAARYSPRWLAIKLLENDPHVIERVRMIAGTDDLLAAARQSIRRIERLFGDESDILITDRRYGFINGLVRQVVQRPPLDRHTLSDRIDGVITHPLLGIPVFMVAMWITFQMTTSVSAYYLDWIDGVIRGPVTRWVVALLSMAGPGGSWVESLAVDGVLAGVGGVLVFVPTLAFMYFFTALLEDSGYMARAALLADRFMYLLGLHGKSFIPMLLGFGCNVPGIYATRTLENERDRLLTGLLVPFMSCGARLPVYMVIGTAFFGPRAGTLVFALYFLGIAVAILIGLLLKNTLLHVEEEAPFVIELPPYRIPSMKGVLIHTWEHTGAFIRNAGTIVLGVSLAIWLLLAIPVNAPQGARFAQVGTEHSALAALGRAIAPAFTPAGYGEWEPAAALVTGFAAKELVVSTLSQIYTGSEGSVPVTAGEPTSFRDDLAEIGATFAVATWDTFRATLSLIPGVDLFGEEEAGTIDTALTGALREAFTPLSAVALCVFVLLTVPCAATTAALRQEFGLKWAAFSVGMMLTVSWMVSVLVYQGGRLLGFG